MAGNREERLMMRQRGAGTRQVKEFGFDLILPFPGQSISPLKVPKSGRAPKAPLPASGPQQSTRRTPTLAKGLAYQEHADGIPSTVVQNEGEEDVLGSNPLGSVGNPARVNKRKHDGGHNLEESAMKKKRKAIPMHGSRKAKATTTITNDKAPNNVGGAFRSKGAMRQAMKNLEKEEPPTKTKRTALAVRRSQKAESSKTISTHETLVPVEDASLNKGITKDGTLADPRLAEITGPLQVEEAAGARGSNKQAARMGRTNRDTERSNIKPDKKPSQRKQNHHTNTHQENMDQESQNQQKPTAEQVAPAAATTRKRKKRKSIGQQTTKRAKKVVRSAPQRKTNPGANHETSDLVNELLDDTIGVASEKPDTEESQTLESVNRGSTGPPNNNLQHATSSAPIDASCQDTRTGNDHDTILDRPKKKTEQRSKPRPRKKRRSVTQARRPKPKTAMNNEAQKGLHEENSIAPEPKTVIPASETLEPSRRARGRKPLSNITNVTPALASAESTTASAHEQTRPPGPPKKRGRPPKNPDTDTSNTSASIHDTEKLAPMPESLAAFSTRPTVASAKTAKTAKAPAKPRKILKAPKDPTPRVVQIPVRRPYLDDLGSDSDDPLSGASVVRLKKTLKPVKKVARHSTELRLDTSTETAESKMKPMKITKEERSMNKATRPTQRVKQVSTPQGKIIEDEKRKAAEQKEIEVLLSSIGKAVRRGRVMAAGGA